MSFEHCEDCNDTGIYEDEYCDCDWGDALAEHQDQWQEEPLLDEDEEIIT